MHNRKKMIARAEEMAERKWHQTDWIQEIYELSRTDDRKPHEKVVDTTQDKAPEVYWGLRSYNTDDPEAECKKGLEHLHRREYYEAHICFLKAARSGYPEGQFRLGSLYLFGRGVAQDFNLAETWFREAARNGFIPQSMEALAMLARYKENSRKG